MSLFVTFEGPEGSGKSTQARRLFERLEAAGCSVLLAREPGSTRIGDNIRQILLNLEHTEMVATTETLLFSAARAQLVAERIRPQLARGGIVVCDRFADSTFAYQGYGLGRNLDELRTITRIATGDLGPDITFYLDLPVTEGLARKRGMEASNSASSIQFADPDGTDQGLPEWNRLDARELTFHERVRMGYLELAQAEPRRWRILDARLDRDRLADTIWQALQPYIAPIKSL